MADGSERTLLKYSNSAQTVDLGSDVWGTYNTVFYVRRQDRIPQPQLVSFPFRKEYALRPGKLIPVENNTLLLIECSNTIMQSHINMTLSTYQFSLVFSQPFR